VSTRPRRHLAGRDRRTSRCTQRVATAKDGEGKSRAEPRGETSRPAPEALARRCARCAL
jgi:hypothetical protein